MTDASQEGTPRRAFNLVKMPQRSRGRSPFRKRSSGISLGAGRTPPQTGTSATLENAQGALNVNVCTLEMSPSQRNVIAGPLGLEGPPCLRFWGSDVGPGALLLETLESSLCAECGEPKARPALVLAAGRVGSAPGESHFTYTRPSPPYRPELGATVLRVTGISGMYQEGRLLPKRLPETWISRSS